MSLEGGSGAEPREGVTTPSPSSWVFLTPPPEWIVKGMTYAVTYGDDTPGARRISPPEPPLLFSVSLGKRKYPLPQTPTSLSQRMSRISSKQWETCSHLKSQPSRSEFRKEFCKKSFERGSGKTCSLKVFPEAEPHHAKPKTGLEGGLCINNFHPPDCGGVFTLQLFFACQRKVGKRK